MRNIGIISGFAAFALAACQPAVEKAKVAPHQQYDAKTFFDTTAVSMSSPTAYSFSLDGANLLVATDKSGVFNAAALPVAGGDAAPLTQSPNIATFAISYFPADDRICRKQTFMQKPVHDLDQSGGATPAASMKIAG